MLNEFNQFLSEEHKDQDIDKDYIHMVDRGVNVIGGIIMLILFGIFAGFLIKHKRWKYFEVTILISMTLFYLDKVSLRSFGDKIYQSLLAATITNILQDVTCLIAHWAYASQYMKTCMLLPGLLNKARLLLERHQTTIRDEYK